MTSAANSSAEPTVPPRGGSDTLVYWTAFIGLFFDYYDLYLFIYLERTLAAHFALSTAQSGWLQFTGLAGVGAGALLFGYLADRWGRGRMMLAVFGVYLLGIAGISLAWDYASLLGFRLVASLALGAEWGISHTYLAERVGGATRYRFSALLQFSILGGLLAALATRYGLPLLGWRGLFAASLVPIIVLSFWRWRSLQAHDGGTALPAPQGVGFLAALRLHGGRFTLCLLLASLTIASGTVNVFYARELPQSVIYTIFFWGNVAPGMLLGAWLVRRAGVARALTAYAVGLLVLSLVCWLGLVPAPALTFALVLPLLNGIPFGLMGAYFNEVFREYRTMFSGAAYNLGRIAAGFSPLLITGLGLQAGGRYFLFSAALGLAVGAVALLLGRQRA